MARFDRRTDSQADDSEAQRSAHASQRARPIPGEAEMSAHDMNAKFSKALGLPKGTTRAVLTLQVGRMPRLHITANVMDGAGHPVLNADATEVEKIEFSYRLVPFGELPK